MSENYSDFGDEVHIPTMVSNWRCPQCGAVAHDGNHKCAETYEQLVFAVKRMTDVVVDDTIKITRLKNKGACPACFTSSWQPCAPGTLNCIPDTAPHTFMVCGYCELEAAYLRLASLAKQAAQRIEDCGLSYDEFDELADAVRELPGGVDGS